MSTGGKGRETLEAELARMQALIGEEPDDLDAVDDLDDALADADAARMVAAVDDLLRTLPPRGRNVRSPACSSDVRTAGEASPAVRTHDDELLGELLGDEDGWCGND